MSVEQEMQDAMRTQEEFVAGFIQNLEAAKEAQVEIAELKARLEASEAAKGVNQAELRLNLSEMKQKFLSFLGWLIILAVLLIALFLMITRDASAAKITRERTPKPQIVQVDGVSVPILVEQPMGETPQVELLDADGWAKGCDSSNGWTTGYQGNLALTFSPVTSEASVLVTFQHTPEMGDQTYSLVDGSQSLTREEWRAVTLATGEVWRYVDSGQAMSFDTTGVDAVLAVHDYLFLEACLR